MGPPRPDGRHELVSLVQAVSLADDVRMEPADGEDEVVCEAVEGENLAARALAAYRDAAGWPRPPVRVTIDKRVPVAAGMGGGSSDAAATLRLAQASGLSPASPDLIELAAGLGSDVPALLDPGLVLVTGTGERVRRLEPLAPLSVLILPSPHRLPTGDVYREADRLGLPRSARELDDLARAVDNAARPGAELPHELLVNDLEPAARSLCPQIDAALGDARAAGAATALVSGSGPTVFGIFHGGAEAATAAEEAARELAARHPGAVAVEPLT